MREILTNIALSTGAISTERTPTLAVLYGKGVFTTIAVRNGLTIFWEKHWRRLAENAKRLNVDLSQFSEVLVKTAVDKAIEQSGVASGRVRLSFLDESTSPIWTLKCEQSTTLSILCGDVRKASETVRLTQSVHNINTTSPLAGIKSCNYLEPLMAFDEAKSRGFDEAVRLNERGEVSSACLANVFWLKGERLFTPSLMTGCLAGTTREYVLENTECEEVEAGIEAIREADEIFLTSAGIGVVTVAMFEGKNLKNTGHPITKVLPV